MALNIKIDFEHRYQPVAIADNIHFSTFDSVLKNGKKARLGIKISTEEHPFMPDVYNLSFGPINEVFEMDDRAKLTHRDHSKVFSTIVFAGLSFLTQHKDKFLGFDGSNSARAYMYYRCLQNNYAYLDPFFVMYGVNYYVRVLREESGEEATFFDKEDVLAIPRQIGPGDEISAIKLYNYFIFKLK